MTLAYCPHCGAKLSYGGKTNFCAGCGQSLRNLMPASGSLEGEVVGLIQGEKFIEAIKVYREKTATTLKQAKEDVEAMAKKYNLPIRNRAQASILSVAIAVFLLILGIAVVVFLSNT